MHTCSMRKHFLSSFEQHFRLFNNKKSLHVSERCITQLEGASSDYESIDNNEDRDSHKFGNIRFDSENVAKHHGQHDSAKKPKTRRNKSDFKSKDHHQVQKKCSTSNDSTNTHAKNCYEYMSYIKSDNIHTSSTKKAELSLKSHMKKFRPTFDPEEMLHSEILSALKSRVLFDESDIVAIDKPYGMSIHGGGRTPSNTKTVLTTYISELAEFLKTEQLHTVHRLDKYTTGVMLLAKSQAMADTLHGLLQEHAIYREYRAICVGIPKHNHGLIDVPIAEGTIEGKHRMVLSPVITENAKLTGLVPKFSKEYMAITEYEVLSTSGFASYLRLKPQTGIKHQLRVHLAFCLGCPILGDHKYSHLRKLAPQKLPGDMLDRLCVPQTKVRHIGMHLHSHVCSIPSILNGRNLRVQSHLPSNFVTVLKRLKLNH